MRCLPCTALVVLTVAGACASTQPTETAPLPTPVAAPPSASPLPVPVPPRGFDTAGAFAVEGDEGLARLCQTFRDENSMVFS